MEEERNDQIIATNTKDGELVIRDETNPDAWIKSDVVISLDRDHEITF